MNLVRERRRKGRMKRLGGRHGLGRLRAIGGSSQHQPGCHHGKEVL